MPTAKTVLAGDAVSLAGFQFLLPLPSPSLHPKQNKKNKDVSVINRQARGGNTGSNYMGTAQLGSATVDSLGMTKKVSQNSLTYVGEFFSELSAVYIPHRF